MWVMQANYGFGHGWEDECVEKTQAEALQRLKEYRENAPKYSYRIKRYRGGWIHSAHRLASCFRWHQLSPGALPFWNGFLKKMIVILDDKKVEEQEEKKE